MKIDYDSWWASLTVAEKERISTKALKRDCFYPECTSWWKGLLLPFKKRIYKHCISSHGDVVPEEKEGREMSY